MAHAFVYGDGGGWTRCVPRRATRSLVQKLIDEARREQQTLIAAQTRRIAELEGSSPTAEAPAGRAAAAAASTSTTSSPPKEASKTTSTWAVPAAASARAVGDDLSKTVSVEAISVEAMKARALEDLKALEDLETLKQHNDMLKAQLKKAGVTAIDEIVSFEEAKTRLRDAAARLMRDEGGSLEDEKEMVFGARADTNDSVGPRREVPGVGLPAFTPSFH